MLRTVRLNTVGYAALLGLVVAGAAALGGAGAAVGLPVAGAALGAVLVLAGVVVLDRRRWAAAETGLGWTDDAAQVASVHDALASRGVGTTVEDHGDGPTLRYRHRDGRAVREVLGEHGVTFPG